MNTHNVDRLRKENLIDVGTRLNYLGRRDRPLSSTFQPACQCRNWIFSYTILEFGDFFVVGVIFLLPNDHTLAG